MSINHWAAIGYGLVVTPWGAYPGHPPHDIQSGVGVVHNTLMFSRVEKGAVYVRSDLALKHGAGVEAETTKSAEAYAPFPKWQPGPPESWDGLPWAG